MPQADVLLALFLSRFWL